MDVSENIVTGFKVRRVLDAEGKPPLTGANTCWGTLWYGNIHPTVILSSYAIKMQFAKIMKPGHVVPVWYRNHFGFHFCGSPWVNDESLDGTDWIVMLREDMPDDPRLNGCYLFSM